jgi:hypothetical protein
MLPILAWKAWYDDGSVYRSTTHAWVDLPDVGMQLLSYYHPDGYRTFYQGQDEYTLFGGDGPAKLGRWMEDAAYLALCDEALNDPERLP